MSDCFKNSIMSFKAFSVEDCSQRPNTLDSRQRLELKHAFNFSQVKLLQFTYLLYKATFNISETNQFTRLKKV